MARPPSSAAFVAAALGALAPLSGSGSAVASPEAAPVPVAAAGADALGPVCGIRLVRAPDDLRADVEARLAADASACSGSLDVWLVPSAGGIYVQARDRGGRIRERQVPDAAVVATLLASWVEIDVAQPLWAPAATDASPAAPSATTVPQAPGAAFVAPTSTTPPSLAPMARRDAGDATLVRSPARRRGPTITAAAVGTFTGSEMPGGGIRLGVDVRVGRFSLGIAGQGVAFGNSPNLYRHRLGGTEMVAEHSRSSADLLATVRYPIQLGRLQLQPQLGVGVGTAEHVIETFSGNSAWGASPTSVGGRAEMGLAASLAVATRWSLEAGLSSGFATYHDLDDATYDQPPVWFDGINSGTIGVRYQP
jgi:hypothetical protein